MPSLHHLKVLQKENWIPKIIVELHPTSPLRTVDDLNGAVELFLENRCEPVVVSVCESGHPFQWSFRKKRKIFRANFRLEIFYRNREAEIRKNIYSQWSNIYIYAEKLCILIEVFILKKILPYIMLAERSIDIDNEIDFKLAELIINNKEN